MATEEQSKGSAAQTPESRKIRLDTSNVKSAYCNFFTAQDAAEEVVLNFGYNQRWDPAQKDLHVQMLQQVILHPATARRVKDALVALFEKRDARQAPAKAPSAAPKKPN